MESQPQNSEIKKNPEDFHTRNNSEFEVTFYG